MSSLQSAFASYQAAFGEDPPLYQLRFYGDEDIIDLIDESIKKNEKLTAEALEHRLPPDVLY